MRKFFIYTYLAFGFMSFLYSGQDYSGTGDYVLDGSMYCEKKISSQNNDSCFSCFGITRAEAMNNVMLFLGNNFDQYPVRMMIAYNIFDFTPAEKHAEIMNQFSLYILQEDDDTTKNDTYYQLVELYSSDVLCQIDYVKNNPVFLDVKQNTKSRSLSMMDLLALANGYAFDVYVQKSSMQENKDDLPNLTLFHHFDPKEYGFKGNFSSKKLIYTFMDPENSQGHDHYNELVPFLGENEEDNALGSLCRSESQIVDYDATPEEQASVTPKKQLEEENDARSRNREKILNLTEKLDIYSPITDKKLYPNEFKNRQLTSQSKFIVTDTRNGKRYDAKLKTESLTREFKINGVMYKEKDISGYNNQCGFFCFNTDRITGMNNVRLISYLNIMVRHFIVHEVCRRLISMDFAYFDFQPDELEKVNMLLTKYHDLNPMGDPQNVHMLNLYEFSSLLADRYLDFFKKTNAMLEVERNCGESNLCLLDIIAMLNNSSLEVYIQEKITEDGFIDASELTLYHSFYLSQLGIQGDVPVKKLLLTNHSKKKVEHNDLFWRNHYNVLEPK